MGLDRRRDLLQPQPHAVGFMGGNAEGAGPAVELPGGNFGAGYVIPGSNPAFQANSLAAPTDQSGANTPPFATPQPAAGERLHGGQPRRRLRLSTCRLSWRARSVRNITWEGQFTLPVERERGPGLRLPPINPTTTPGDLSASPGVRAHGARWLRSTATVLTQWSVAAVPAWGLLETNEAHVPNPGPIVQYRHFSPSSGFGSAVTLASGEVGMDGTLSQDSAGDIFATWLDRATGVDLAYSSDGGATWSKPEILFSNAGNPSGIGLLSSAVGPSGQGWAVYAVGKREYAQRFKS